MPDPDKALRRNVHQKTPDKLNPWQSQLLPPSFVPVIFHGKGYSFFIHADDPMVADRDAVGIFPEIFNHRLGTMECLFAVRDPLCAITGMLTINALAASDSVIVPVQAQYLPAKGMTQLMKTIGKVQRQINPALKVDGVLLTLADMRTNLARVTAESIRQNYGRMIKVYQTVIPVGVKAAETSAAGQSIYRYDKNGTVAKAYASFTREVVRDGEKQRNKAEPSRSR